MARETDSKITSVRAEAYRIPTDAPEADGTIAWNSTTLVLVEIEAAGEKGIGYSYSDVAAATLIRDVLVPAVVGRDAFDIPGAWCAMRKQARNLNVSGLVMMAVSAVDIALWDLKAKILDMPLAKLLGCVRSSVPVYGSGGFTSYNDKQLRSQLSGWVSDGIMAVKMKVGTNPEDDVRRVKVAREAIGVVPQLFVDANGAYERKQALIFAQAFAELDVVWFEEPVATNDIQGMRLVRNRAPARMSIAGGEYGSTLDYFRRMLESEAVDVLQADATRCGATGFMGVSAICEARHLPLSAHTAPSIHMHLGCAAAPLANLEYFHDHVRIEKQLFDGFRAPEKGRMEPDWSRPGLGLEFKRKDAEKYGAA